MRKTFIDNYNNLNTSYSGTVGKIDPDGTVRSGSNVVGHVDKNGLFTDQWGRKEWVDTGGSSGGGDGGGLVGLAVLLYIYLVIGIFTIIYRLLKMFIISLKNAYIYSSTGNYPVNENNKLPTSGYSTFSAACGFFGLIIPIIGLGGIFFGFKAYAEIDQNRARIQGKSRAFLGILAGIFSIITNSIFLLIIVSKIY